MGCDIHAYIEYKEKEGEEWRSFGHEYFYLCRDYDMFAVMAGVRNYKEYEPVSEPKGLPEDIAWQAKQGNTLYIVYKDECDDEGYVTEETANDWISRGYSKMVGDRRVTHPDWHTHSWLTLNELRECFKRVEKIVIGQEHPRCFDVSHDCLMACMEAIEKRGYTSRLVFWFDN
jgi:hypothetical protein